MGLFSKNKVSPGECPHSKTKDVPGKTDLVPDSKGRYWRAVSIVCRSCGNVLDSVDEWVDRPQ